MIAFQQAKSLSYPPIYERLTWDYKKADSTTIRKALDLVNWERLLIERILMHKSQYLKELRNYNRKLFLCFATKIGKSTTNILISYFSKNIITLWHIKVTICRQKNKFTSHKQYSFGLTFLEIQRRFIQTKYTTRSLLCLKRIDSQTFKRSNCKKRFLQCLCHSYNLLL